MIPSIARKLLAPAIALTLPVSLNAQAASPEADVTFTQDIAPILQQSCQRCHRVGGVAPMALVEYDTVRAYARKIRRRTSIRDRMGAMPPWYVEKEIGIQHFKDDPSLSDEQIAAIATWVRNGTPEGDPADMPAPLVFDDAVGWTSGEPDLIVSTQEFLVTGEAPDWWGDIKSVPTGLTEDRYVASVEIREINNVKEGGALDRETVGGLYVFHHMVWSTRVLDDPEARSITWPVHEVGRNPDIFDANAGRLLKAGSSVMSSSTHLHSNGRDTKAHLEIGFRFHPRGYEPEYRPIFLGLGNGSDIDIKAGETNQELHAYVVLQQHTKIVTFEPHLHAPGYRMCLEAIWGFNVETLSCVGYDHNWVRGYAFDDNHQPLLPKGTVLHIIGYMDNTPRNRNVPDTRNWQGSGNRSVSNMFIDLGMQLALTEEQFLEAMAERRENLGLTANDHVIGCPLCLVIPGSR
jgi:mono/diheme cytochrome c family protein